MALPESSGLASGSHRNPLIRGSSVYQYWGYFAPLELTADDPLPVTDVASHLGHILG